MRKRIFRATNKIILFFMAILGFATACKPGGGMVVAYGSPHADFVVKGNITSAKDNSVIKGIRVIAQGVTTYGYYPADTVKSDASGNYTAKITEMSLTQIKLNLTDIDGSENGSFQSLDTLVTYTNPKFTGGDGSWYIGSTEQVLNIKMKPKQ